MSLNATIVNMAQDFVGSNNVPLLEPNGQFGTRLQNGRSICGHAANPRCVRDVAPSGTDSPALRRGMRSQRRPGKDAASARYIFTKLSPLAFALFPRSDEALLDYTEEDGQVRCVHANAGCARGPSLTSTDP